MTYLPNYEDPIRDLGVFNDEETRRVAGYRFLRDLATFATGVRAPYKVRRPIVGMVDRVDY